MSNNKKKINIGYLCGICGKVIRESGVKTHEDKCAGFTLTVKKWDDKYFFFV